MPRLKAEYLDPSKPPIGTADHVSLSLQAAINDFPDDPATKVAAGLIRAAFDYTKSEVPFMPIAWHVQTRGGIGSRYNREAPYFDAWQGQDLPYVDPDDGQIDRREQFNHLGTRRATMTGVPIEFGKDGLPINPYYEDTGISGRSSGLWGSNSIVDVLGLVSRRDESGMETLYEINVRKPCGKLVAVGGYIETEPNEDGEHIITEEVIIDNAAKEFFEEAISGSVALRPEYESRVHEYPGIKPEQQLAAAKLDMVMTHDPSFIERLKEVIRDNGRTAYAGPILLSAGTMNNSWGETNAKWFNMTDANWIYIKGQDEQNFGYDLVAGDDVIDLTLAPSGSETMHDTTVNHRILKAYMIADYILARQAEGETFEDSHVLKQGQEMINTLDSMRLGNHLLLERSV